MEVEVHVSPRAAGYLTVLSDETVRGNSLSTLTVLHPSTLSGQRTVTDWNVIDGQPADIAIWVIWSATAVELLDGLKVYENPRDAGVVRDPQAAERLRNWLEPKASLGTRSVREGAARLTVEGSEPQLVTLVRRQTLKLAGEPMVREALIAALVVGGCAALSGQDETTRSVTPARFLKARPAATTTKKAPAAPTYRRATRADGAASDGDTVDLGVTIWRLRAAKPADVARLLVQDRESHDGMDARAGGGRHAARPWRSRSAQRRVPAHRLPLRHRPGAVRRWLGRGAASDLSDEADPRRRQSRDRRPPRRDSGTG